MTVLPYVEYIGDGVTTTFTIPFPYIDETDVRVSLNGVDTTDFSFANATTIEMDSAPPNGVPLELTRDTDDSTLKAVFYPGATIRAQDLNACFEQSLYCGQEAAFTASKAVTGDIPAGGITSSMLADSCVSTNKLGPDAVTRAKMADASVGTTEVMDGAITADKLGPGAVTTLKILDAAVTQDKIANSAVSTAKIADASITSDKFAPGAIPSASIPPGSITATELASNAVTEAKILSTAVTEAKIGPGAVTETKIATGAVTSDKIGSAAVTQDKIGTNILTPRVSSINGGQLAGLRNLLINSVNLINQRVYSSGSSTTTANQYTIDRWRVVTNGQNLSWTLTNGIPVFTAPAGGVEQVIEAYSNLGGQHTLSWTGTATATVNGTTVSNGGQVTLTANTDVTVRFSNGTFSKPQLEPGPVATPFETRPVALELSLCRRYYLKSYALNSAPGATNNQCITFSSPSAGTGSMGGSVMFPCVMRTTPTVKFYSPVTGTINKVRAKGVDENYSSPDYMSNTLMVITAGSGVSGDSLLFHYTADAEL